MTTVRNAETPNGLRDAESLAAQLGISVSSVYRKRSLGESLPRAIKVGARVRWRQSDIDAWIEQQIENK